LDKEASVYCAGVVYPRKPGARFDLKYFAEAHAPMFVRLMGDNCVRYEVHESLDAPGAPASTFIAAAYFWVKSAEAFGAVLAQHGEQIYGDIRNFTDLEPSRSWSRVLGEAG
jgi:uncharacterized protein (TIGR02118 family)